MRIQLILRLLDEILINVLLCESRVSFGPLALQLSDSTVFFLRPSNLTFYPVKSFHLFLAKASLLPATPSSSSDFFSEAHSIAERYMSEALRPCPNGYLVMARESRSRTSKPIRGLFQLLKPLILQLPGLCSAACFTSNGTNVNTLIGYPDDGIYAPCKNTTNGASMCCATGIYRGSRDNCYEDGSGLCYNKNVGPTVHFWRESCTDPTWRDPACVKLFNNIPGKWCISVGGRHFVSRSITHTCPVF